MSAQNDSFNASSCKICFDSYDGTAKKPELMVPCGHTFCKECLWKLLTPECPTCKMPYTTTVTVWDLIPSENATTEKPVVESNLKTDLSNFKALLEYIEELNQKESEVNNEKISDAEFMINSKAEEIINRVIDEQNRLLHRVKIYKNLLEKRKIRNKMIENFAKKQYELISLQANYNSQISNEKLNDIELVKEIKEEIVQLKNLRENIEAHIKTDKSIFNCRDHTNLEPLLGEVSIADTNETVEFSKNLQLTSKSTVTQSEGPSEAKQASQSEASSSFSKLNPNAAPFGLNQISQQTGSRIAHPVLPVQAIQPVPSIPQVQQFVQAPVPVTSPEYNVGNQLRPVMPVYSPASNQTGQAMYPLPNLALPTTSNPSFNHVFRPENYFIFPSGFNLTQTHP